MSDPAIVCNLKPFDPFFKAGSGFRYGSLVCYKGMTRTVHKVFFALRANCHPKIPAKRVVSHLDLGGTDVYVPIGQVRLIRL